MYGELLKLSKSVQARLSKCYRRLLEEKVDYDMAVQALKQIAQNGMFDKK